MWRPGTQLRRPVGHRPDEVVARSRRAKQCSVPEALRLGDERINYGGQARTRKKGPGLGVGCENFREERSDGSRLKERRTVFALALQTYA